jgi:hypothetical protein
MVIYSVNIHSLIGVLEVENSIQCTQVYLEDGGLKVTPNTYQACIFGKEGKRQLVVIGKSL